MMERPNKELTEEEEKALLAMSVEEVCYRPQLSCLFSHFRLCDTSLGK